MSIPRAPVPLLRTSVPLEVRARVQERHRQSRLRIHASGAELPFKPEEYAPAAKAFLPKIPPDQYPYLHGLSLQVIDGSHDGLHDFQFGLELILDGLERVLRTI